MTINTKYTSLPSMNEESVKRNKVLDKIATGIELNMADSASRTIASQMQNDISTYSQQLMNTNDSISMNQIADGSLSNLSEQSQKLNDISVRSNNDSLNITDKQALKQEFQKTQETMQSIIDTTSYNGNPLLNSTVSAKNLSMDNQNGISSYMEVLSSKQTDISASSNNLQSQANTLLTQITQTSASKSQISDTDISKAISDYQKSNQKLDVSLMVMAHQKDYLKESMERLLG